MNSHQRRKLRRLYQRAFGDHVDYYVTITTGTTRITGFTRTDDDEQEYCQQCGAMLDDDAPRQSFDVVRRPYVTASGDLYCDVCGRAMDEEEERLMDEENEFSLWDYETWEDIVEGESGGRYIGPGSEYPADGVD